MIVKSFESLLCPLDGVRLERHEKTWTCKNGHSFDVAKQGYTHLLPVQNKRSLDPGDHKSMIAARQCFLQAGYYEPIAKAVNNAVLAFNQDGESLSILDAGCGEGYYLRALTAEPINTELDVLGVDISKWAVLSAAKQEARANWIVSSNANLPVEKSSLDCVLCMFGFPVYPEFSRVLKPGGLLLLVDSGEDHLRELRDIIYPVVFDVDKKLETSNKQETPDGFSKLKTDIVRFVFHVDSAEMIANLLAMTPHLYRAKPEGRARAAALTELTLTADVVLNYYIADT